jgi:hypothetical protein
MSTCDLLNLSIRKGAIGECYFCPILRSTKFNDNIMYGNLVALKNGTKIDANNEIILVKCLSKAILTSYEIKQLKLKEKKSQKPKINKTLGNRMVLYEYVHFDFKFKKPILPENKKATNINVMFLVLDGVSLSSMKRALPRTLKFLNSSNDFYLFEKHHVIGSNTFENLVPMLTNMEAKQILENKENILLSKPFDDLPFIWKNFSQRFGLFCLFVYNLKHFYS